MNKSKPDIRLIDFKTTYNTLPPKVDPGNIQKLVEALDYTFHVVEGSTYTICHASLQLNGKQHVIATGSSSTLIASEFKKETGELYAKEMARANAREKLWELETWRLIAEHQQSLTGY